MFPDGDFPRKSRGLAQDRAPRGRMIIGGRRFAVPGTGQMMSDTLDDFTGIRTRGGFVPVPLAALRAVVDRPFSLFRRAGAGYVLYRAPHTPLEIGALDRLADNRVSFLYIRTSDHRLYTRYLETGLASAMADPAIGKVERVRVLYITAVRLLQEVFEDPDALGDIRRMLPIVDHIADCALADPGVLASLAAMSHHDHYTATHMVNVAGYMTALAVAGGFADRDALREVALGGLLHDLGKVKISAAILNKPDRLTDVEWAVVRRHPSDSVQMASSQLTLTDAVRAVLGDHHERLDGSGYPRGLSDEAIHAYARIAAVCDVFDALTSQRDYRRIMTADQALTLMSESAGTHFDAGWLNTWRELVAGYIDVRHWPPPAIDQAMQSDARRPPPRLPLEDRRRHPRRRFQAAVVIRDLGDGPVIREAYAGRGVEISRGGLSMHLPRPFKPGSRIQVVLPNLPPIANRLVSRVVRCRKLSDERFLTAVEFEREATSPTPMCAANVDQP